MRTLLLSLTVLVPCATALVAERTAAFTPTTSASACWQDPKPAEKPKGDKPAEPGAKPADAPQGDKDPKDAKAEKSEGGWVTSYEDAVARAKKEKKLIVADFTGSDWCSWCQKLEGEVFSKPEFKKWAEKNVVLLQLDFPRHKELPKELKAQNDKLQKEYRIDGFPTVLFLDAKGKKVGQMGYQEGGPDKWTKDADKILKKGKA